MARDKFGSRRDWHATPSQETYLRWLFEMNLREALDNANDFERLLNQQRRVRKYFGLQPVGMSDDDRFEDLDLGLERLEGRLAFDGEMK